MMADDRAPRVEDTFLSTTTARRVVLVLLALWNLFEGLSLTFLRGKVTASLGRGLEGDAAQRLLGAHILVLAVAYLLLARPPRHYRAFLWLPYAVQLAIIVSTAYDLAAGSRSVSDGVLPLVVALVFLTLLLGVALLGRQAGQIIPGPVPTEPGEPAGAEPPAQMPTDEIETAPTGLREDDSER